MKIAIERSAFANALAKVKDSAGNPSMPITDNVKMETSGDEHIRLTATNLEMTTSTVVRCQVQEQGATTVPIKLLVQMVNVMTASIVEFSVDDRTNAKAKLVGGDTKFALATTPVSQFPVPDSVDGDTFTIGCGTLKGLISDVSYAVSSDNYRRFLMGINLFARNGRLHAIGSDGYRFAITSAPFEGTASFNIILPSLAFKSLRAVLGDEGDVTVRIKSGSAALFSLDGWSMQTKLISETYPDVISMLGRIEDHTVEIDRTVFADAIRQASVTSAGVGSRYVAITVSDGVIRLTSNDNERSESEIIIPAKFSGEGCTFRMNPKFILDALSQFSDDGIMLRFANATKPIELTTGDGVGYAQIASIRV